MGGTTWEGHATLKAALDGLATAKGVSATRVKAVANAAFQYAKDYKRVVHDVEIFLWKAEVEHRLAGLYAMDAIMRQSQAKLGAKDVFVKRFLLHMNNTIAAVKKIPAEHQENVRHVIEEWQTRGYYTPQDIEQAGGLEYSLTNAGRPSSVGGGSSSATRASPTHADPASKEKLASLLSIIKKQKQLKEQQGDLPQAPLLSQPPLLPTPTPQQRTRLQESPGSSQPRRQAFDDRHHGRSTDGYARDQDTPSRDRGAPRSRERSRSRSRDRGAPSARPRDRSQDRSRGRDASAGTRDRRDAPAPLSPPRSRVRRDSDSSRRDSFEDSRDAKKPRGSRWGPPRPSDSGGDDNRPPVIDTRDHERSTRFESRSPRNRYDGPPGPGPAPGQGSWPPTGYQGPPPPFRAGPPPSNNSFPPPGPSGIPNGAMPPPFRGGPVDREPPASRGRDPAYGQSSQTPAVGSFDGGPRGPPGPAGDSSRSNDSSHGMPPRSGTPEHLGDQPTGSTREVCRKFVAGRCTFGDRCWHIHNQSGGAPDSMPARNAHTEMNQARRKTVLCANFPQGTCRYGDRCSFAHGEDDLDKSAVGMRRPPPQAQDPLRGGPSPRGASPHGAFQPQRQSPAVSPHRHQPLPSSATANGPPARLPYGSGLPQQPVGGTNQWAGAAAASGYGAYAAPQAPPAYVPPSSQPRPTGAAVATAPVASSTMARDRAPSRDEDETEAAGPEFTLQYDEDD